MRLVPAVGLRVYENLANGGDSMRDVSENMNKSHMAYFEKDDVLHFAVSDEFEAGSVEITPNITAELNADGDLIGVEILQASTFIRNLVMESVQAKVLDLANARREPLKHAMVAEEPAEYSVGDE